MHPEIPLKRVLLVDDHPAVLGRVEQLLQGEFHVVGALRDGSGLEAAIERCRPDIIVLDIALPGRSGLEWARCLAAGGSRARIVFLTVHEDADFVREALAAGGLGYVVKSRIGVDLLEALRTALAGRLFISPCPGLEELILLYGTCSAPDRKIQDSSCGEKALQTGALATERALRSTGSRTSEKRI